MGAAQNNPNYRGWQYDRQNDRLNMNYDGDPSAYIDASGVTVPSGETLTVAGSLATTGAQTASTIRFSGAGFFGLGTGEAVTIASGVATVTRPYVILDAEGAGTSDTLDSIVYTGVAAGDFLLLTVNATDTITVDDANIALGAATRAIAPGGSLLLQYDGTQFVERTFLTAADNA